MSMEGLTKEDLEQLKDWAMDGVMQAFITGIKDRHNFQDVEIVDGNVCAKFIIQIPLDDCERVDPDA